VNGASHRSSASAAKGRAASARKRSRRNGAAALKIARAVRWSKVMTAQARIATGYYDRKDVKEMVLEAVLKELARH
jgi:hypothetical protein